jgi:hypothetical protein
MAQSLPAAAANDPYTGIYSRRDVWWGLVNEAWLSPRDGAPIVWGEFSDNVTEAKRFHAALGKSYHARTYSYYGADSKQKSFEKVTWRMRAGLAPDKKPRPAVGDVLKLAPAQLRMDGTSPEYVGGQTEVHSYGGPYGGGVSIHETSYWELHCEMQNGAGDGTVPTSSGAAPLTHGGASVQQQFRLTGFGHEPSFKNGTAQHAVLYAITKIAGQATRPQ